MIMVFYGLAEGCQNKNAAGAGRPAAIDLVKILSQPQVRAGAKPIKEILAAGGVVHWLAVHEAIITERNRPSSRTCNGERYVIWGDRDAALGVTARVQRAEPGQLVAWPALYCAAEHGAVIAAR
jgi:hypothetical protein